jgi:predicted RNA binding protein YcfA (HicA-like mRNA interferase family)
MAIATDQILAVLRQYGINPLDDDYAEIELPGIGEIEDGERVYSTSLDEVLGRGDDGETTYPDWPFADDPRMREWLGALEEIIRGSSRVVRVYWESRWPEPPEPHCAWYCPVHFFGHGWGIYIRESCILSHALDIATFVDWRVVHVPHWDIMRHLLRSAFYVFFLHEQFHHKVESLGFRLLVSTGSDRYRPYKANVYRRTFNTADCIEESLANAESYRRLGEPRYAQRVDPAIREGLRRYLKWSIPQQPPGYREGVQFLSEPPYRDGLYSLQSQILDGICPPTTLPKHWSVAPNMITSLADIADDIYVVLPKGAQPIFRPTSVDPGATVSSRALEGALTRHYGYQPVPGGKGSHVKLKKPGSPTIILPGNRPTVSPGVVKNVLDAVGGYPISRLPDLLEGRLGSGLTTNR